MYMKKSKLFFTGVLIACNFLFLAPIFAKNPILKKLGVYSCGTQPKQVLFSPDSSTIVIPLLDDTGFQVFKIEDQNKTLKIIPPRAKQKGFAEGLFIAEKHTFLVSQMTTGYLYEYEYPGFSYKREISCGGQWSKFIAWTSDTQQLAVSNWVSNTVCLIDYKTGNIIKTLKTKASPRGLAFIDNGKSLIVLCFDGGVIQKFDTSTGKVIDSISVEKSAMRHIVVNKNETKAFVSDMYHASIYTIDLATFKIINTHHVFNNTNTIDLYNDQYLFVSSRGPNNPDGYTKRSLVNGHITIIDVVNEKPIVEFEGGNQPTGLDVSPDGHYLCFSNFQDANFELYKIE
ncbi:MAG: 40-residue YVTN family beta-propeller [Treponema sp. CETP13]|nr:MAG: 40-residue YVTN family beta-propeller [Treponema sp. CETP13]